MVQLIESFHFLRRRSGAVLLNMFVFLRFESMINQTAKLRHQRLLKCTGTLREKSIFADEVDVQPFLLRVDNLRAPSRSLR